MSKEALHDHGQEALFELDSEVVPEVQTPSPVTVDPTQIKSFRAPDQDRVSEAYADLGGGAPRETLAVDPPRPPKPVRKPRHSRRGGRAYNEDRGQEESRRIANAAREEALAQGIEPADPTKNKAYMAGRVMLAHEEIVRKADGDPTLALALARARDEQRNR